MRIFNFFTLFVLFLTSNAFSQIYALDEGAAIISGMASFASQRGDLFGDNNRNDINVFTLAPAFDYFIMPNVSLGAGLAYTGYSQGDFNSSSIEIGPSLGYFIGDENSNNFPYFFGRIHYSITGSRDQVISGTDISFGLGLIAPIQNRGHLGFSIEAGYHILDFKKKWWDRSLSGNKIVLGVGIVGLIF